MNRSNYPADWKRISAEIRFERAAGRCEFCGAEHGRPHPLTGSRVILTTAHLDHDTHNNDLPNLRALCQRCHLHHDASHHAASRTATRCQRQADAGQLAIWGSRPASSTIASAPIEGGA